MLIVAPKLARAKVDRGVWPILRPNVEAGHVFLAHRTIVNLDIGCNAMLSKLASD